MTVSRSVRGGQSTMAKRRADRRRSDRVASDERWEAIVDAGSKVFRRLGFAQANLEDVAREVGLNRATLYYYVADKEELLVAIVDEPLERMTSDLRAIAALDLPASERLRRAVVQHMRSLEEAPELCIFLAENLRLLMSGRDHEIQANAHEYASAMAGIVAAGIATGELRDDVDPRLAMLGLIGMLNWSHRWYRPGGAMTLAEIGEQFAATFLDGLRSR
ncbi:MAG TPA: TetR/AcrR family transcriptional regulator [Acidimicrobiia bacterium]|jgi:AcrR family transcriptional regulator